MSIRRFILVVAALVLLAFVAEKSRQLLGEDKASKSGKFAITDCFDMGRGSVACAVKEGVKLYTYSIRASVVERAKHKAYEIALQEALHEGLSVNVAAKQAQEAGRKAGKLASRKTRRITGPVLAAGWDFFEAMFYGGSLGEASMKGFGTLCGTWVGGFEGEKRLGRVGYLLGSHLGSWVGGRLGLMLFDVGNGVVLLGSMVKEAVVSDDDRGKAEF